DLGTGQAQYHPDVQDHRVLDPIRVALVEIAPGPDEVEGAADAEDLIGIGQIRDHRVHSGPEFAEDPSGGSDDAGHFVLDRKQTGEVGTELDPGAREIGGVVCPEAELRQVEYAARLGYGSGRRGLRSAGDTHQQRDIGDRAGHE